MAFFENTRKPTGFGGRLMVTMMNIGHRALADWGLRFLPLAENADVLDCGCGGGANLRLMLKKCPTGKVCGIDYSPVSVEKSRKLNQTAVSAGRCEVLLASVQALPFDDAQFDVATAFETVYFWVDLPACFREVGARAEARRNVLPLQRVRWRSCAGREVDGEDSRHDDLQGHAAQNHAGTGGFPPSGDAQERQRLAVRDGTKIMGRTKQP